MPRSRRDRPPPRVPRPLTCAPHNPSGNVRAAVVVAARLPSAPRNPVVRAQRSAPPTKTAASTGETSNLATTMSSLVKAPLPYEAEAPIECDPRWPLLAADGSVSKRFWLSLSRPSGTAPATRPASPMDDSRKCSVVNRDATRLPDSRKAPCSALDVTTVPSIVSEYHR